MNRDITSSIIIGTANNTSNIITIGIAYNVTVAIENHWLIAGGWICHVPQSSSHTAHCVLHIHTLRHILFTNRKKAVCTMHA